MVQPNPARPSPCVGQPRPATSRQPATMQLMSEHAGRRPIPITGFVWVSGLTLFDAAATMLAVGVLGGVELNPLLLPVIDRLGLGWTMALRTAVGVTAAGLLTLYAPHPDNRWGSRPLLCAAAVLGLLACWHVAQLILYLA